MTYPLEREIQDCALTLSRLPVGRLPQPIFYQVLEKTVMTALEVVPFCTTDTDKVLLFARDKDDPYFAGQVHSPGVMIVPTDGDFGEAFQRLVRTELMDIDIENSPVFVEARLLKTRRGVENAMIHWIRVNPESSGRGTFYEVSPLPVNLIDHHHHIIPRAYSSYQLAKANV